MSIRDLPTPRLGDKSSKRPEGVDIRIESKPARFESFRENAGKERRSSGLHFVAVDLRRDNTESFAEGGAEAGGASESYLVGYLCN